MPTIPPWINVQPSDFAAAGERGLATGVSAANVRRQKEADVTQAALERQRLSQAAAAQQAEIAMASQQLAQKEKMSKMAMEAEREQQERQFLIQQQRTNVTDAYHTATLGLQQKKLQDAAAVNAQKFAAQQKFSALIQAGVPADQAISQVPELLGAGVDTALVRAATSGGGPDRMSDIDKLRYGTTAKELAAAQKSLEEAEGGWFSDEDAPRAKVQQVQSALDEITKKYTDRPQSQRATHRFNPATGKIEPSGQ